MIVDGLKYIIFGAILLLPADGYSQVRTDDSTIETAEEQGRQLIDAERLLFQRLRDDLADENYNEIAKEAFSFILFGYEQPHFTFLQIDDCTFVYSSNPQIYDLPETYALSVANDLYWSTLTVLRFKDVAFGSAEYDVGNGGWLNPYARRDELGQATSLELDCISDGCSSEFHPIFAPEHTYFDRVSLQISSHPSRVQRALDDIKVQCSDGRRY